jgi:uncharacterized protein (DUF427 family)
MTWTRQELATRMNVKLDWPALEPTPRWIRVRLDGELIADTRRAKLLIDYGPKTLPTYFIPLEDVRTDRLADRETAADGTVTWSVHAAGRTAERGAFGFATPPAEFPELADHVSFRWDAVEWYEEEERVLVHARDPHKRVDVLHSSRHVHVEVAGVTIADSHRPTLLFETMLPVRYYLPREDVRTDLLQPSETRTRCPYKGEASYWSVHANGVVVPDVVWSYRDPIPENPRIRDLFCFFNERVDVTVDGKLERPWTPWSDDEGQSWQREKHRLQSSSR